MCEATKTKSESVEHGDLENGRFLPFDRIVVEEGSTPAAVARAKNIATSCISLGMMYIYDNPMSKAPHHKQYQLIGIRWLT